MIDMLMTGLARITLVWLVVLIGSALVIWPIFLLVHWALT